MYGAELTPTIVTLSFISALVSGLRTQHSDVVGYGSLRVIYRGAEGGVPGCIVVVVPFRSVVPSVPSCVTALLLGNGSLHVMHACNKMAFRDVMGGVPGFIGRSCAVVDHDAGSMLSELRAAPSTPSCRSP
ncbi:hypothetical protein AaE_015794 [Aphanomyces astaci]|uniref:Uncharacterized protein n=1 Tax=Aphanomyces astaci TaxID=112090 RepID=A0A6A4Z0Q3_APHAT|nr:hypothetical protein AaE_015794 [Aphanomyces astaci]